MSDTPEDDAKKITVYKRKHNTLQNKMGMRLQTNQEGHLPEEMIEEADALIAQMCEGCYDKIGEQLEILTSTWNEMKKTQSENERTAFSENIFTTAHEIKDIGSLCGYMLAAHFAESLRDYIAETALNLKNQQIIIQAHIDALTVVHKQNLREDGGPAAEELKKMVKIAIEKYH